MLRINAGRIGDGGDDITAREEEDVERQTRGETLRRQRSQVNSYITFIIIINYIKALKWNNNNPLIWEESVSRRLGRRAFMWNGCRVRGLQLH